jgi:hypothetical protein
VLVKFRPFDLGRLRTRHFVSTGSIVHDRTGSEDETNANRRTLVEIDPGLGGGLCSRTGQK